MEEKELFTEETNETMEGLNDTFIETLNSIENDAQAKTEEDPTDRVVYIKVDDDCGKEEEKQEEEVDAEGVAKAVPFIVGAVVIGGVAAGGYFLYRKYLKKHVDKKLDTWAYNRVNKRNEMLKLMSEDIENVEGEVVEDGAGDSFKEVSNNVKDFNKNSGNNNKNKK